MNHESSIRAILLRALYFIYLVISLAKHIIPAFAEYISVLNLAIYPLLLKPAAQREKIDLNSSIRSSRLCATLVVVPMVLWSLPRFCFTRGSL
jgi:hypothetical protein